MASPRTTHIVLQYRPVLHVVSVIQFTLASHPSLPRQLLLAASHPSLPRQLLLASHPSLPRQLLLALVTAATALPLPSLAPHSTSPYRPLSPISAPAPISASPRMTCSLCSRLWLLPPRPSSKAARSRTAPHSWSGLPPASLAAADPLLPACCSLKLQRTSAAAAASTPPAHRTCCRAVVLAAVAAARTCRVSRTAGSSSSGQLLLPQPVPLLPAPSAPTAWSGYKHCRPPARTTWQGQST